MFKLPDEVDHVLAHGAPVDLEEVASTLVPRVLRLHLLHHLLTEAADLGGDLDGHILCALVPRTPGLLLTRKGNLLIRGAGNLNGSFGYFSLLGPLAAIIRRRVVVGKNIIISK